MSYRGRYRQGDHVPLVVITRNGAGTPALPDDAPYAKVFDPDGIIVKKFYLAVANPAVATGVFAGRLRLEHEFDTFGKYAIVWYYKVGAESIVESDDFDLLVGGHQQGSVISAYFYDRPWASFIVQQLDSGRLVANRNPRI